VKIIQQKNPSNQATDKKSTQEPKWLFSRKEIEGIVKEFIRAYIRGQLKLNLTLLPADVKRYMEMETGKPIDEAQAYNSAIQGTFTVPNLMLICAGISDGSNEQYTNAINSLFTFIIIGRTTKSIDGKFLATDIDARLSAVEESLNEIKERFDSTDELVKRTLEYVERIDHMVSVNNEYLS
jgi:hypothetical protein